MKPPQHYLIKRPRRLPVGRVADLGQRHQLMHGHVPRNHLLQRRRSELCERSFAHVCETGGMRRTWLRGLIDVTKRYLIATAAHNLGRMLRTLFGVGKPRTLQGSGEVADGGDGAAADGLSRVLLPLWRVLSGQSEWSRWLAPWIAVPRVMTRRATALAG